jgi:hypothetical protein
MLSNEYLASCIWLHLNLGGPRPVFCDNNTALGRLCDWLFCPVKPPQRIGVELALVPAGMHVCRGVAT